MSHDDFKTEPVEGLPEVPPEGERILWQGRPNWWALTKSATAFWWVMGYFVFLMAWRFVTVIDMFPLGQAIALSLPFLILAAIVGALLIGTTWVQARMAMYTVTNRRVVLRVGAALQVSLNLPYTQIASADLDLRPDGTGTIAFDTLGDVRLAYVVLWPHVRPWSFPARPALRCIDDAQDIANLLMVNARARQAEAERETGPAPVAAE
jgi:hypothetical protein